MSFPKPTILILTTHTGGGHLNLAQSLQDMLKAHYNVVIMDPQSPRVDRFYTFVSRHFVHFLEWQYILTNNKIGSLWQQRILTMLGRERIRGIIGGIQPQLLITTHAMLAYAIARANDKMPKRIPLVFQLTDLGQLHMTWFSEKQADAYLAPTEEILAQSLSQGIERQRLHLTGRPVREQFFAISDATEKHATLAALGLDPAVFTIFLQGGAKGSAGVHQTAENLLNAGVQLQIILATGNNAKIAAYYARHERVRALPFMENIAPYMAAADMIVGKAGASFISEAFMLEKPFLVTDFIPGQESSNLSFIKQHDLGWVCLKREAQQSLLRGIAGNPSLIAGKMESIRTYKAWNMRANQDICTAIDHLLLQEANAPQPSA
jgi:UDP-N-acetylglucosamine:LPS N-acetylglucosamine transferase